MEQTLPIHSGSLQNVLHGEPWWLGTGLQVGPRGLQLGEIQLQPLAAQHGTPLYVYSAALVHQRVQALQDALRQTGAPFRMHYAMKANRFEPLLEMLAGDPRVGIDCCSPREVQRALESGFGRERISFTAGMLSNRDLRTLAALGVHVNLDSASAMRRWAACQPAQRRLGLRVDPEVRVGWGQDPKLAYGSSKFGFTAATIGGAVNLAAELGLEIDELHMHPGWGLQMQDAQALGQAYAMLAEMAKIIPSVRSLNVGGGLCWPQRDTDQPLDVACWAALLKRHLAPSGCEIVCEPGTYIMAASGVLLAEVNTVEPRPSGLWLGIDAGHNVNGYVANYAVPLAIVPVGQPVAAPEHLYHVAGNINEAVDIFAKSLPLPTMQEGDLLALYPTGAYGASMSSDHCMRGFAKEILV